MFTVQCVGTLQHATTVQPEFNKGDIILTVQEAYEDSAEGASDGTSWSSDQVSRFFDAFQQYGQDWAKARQPFCKSVSCLTVCLMSPCVQVSEDVGNTPQQCEALYKQHSLYLNLASQLIQKEAFMGMVRGFQEHNSQVSRALLDFCPQHTTDFVPFLLQWSTPVWALQ